MQICDMIFTLPSFVHFKYEVDEEKAEEFKIISFISMVNGCHHLGIPYGGEKKNEMIGYKPMRPCCKLTLCGTWEYLVWEFRNRVHWREKNPVCFRGIVSNLNKNPSQSHCLSTRRS